VWVMGVLLMVSVKLEGARVGRLRRVGPEDGMAMSAGRM
jgi:hypothetical protein